VFQKRASDALEVRRVDSLTQMRVRLTHATTQVSPTSLERIQQAWAGVPMQFDEETSPGHDFDGQNMARTHTLHPGPCKQSQSRCFDVHCKLKTDMDARNVQMIMDPPRQQGRHQTRGPRIVRLGTRCWTDHCAHLHGTHFLSGIGNVSSGSMRHAHSNVLVRSLLSMFSSPGLRENVDHLFIGTIKAF
jgi:hypothetical protein